jgi:hypothetical protein
MDFSFSPIFALQVLRATLTRHANERVGPTCTLSASQMPHATTSIVTSPGFGRGSATSQISRDSLSLLEVNASFHERGEPAISPQ